jgi:large subunit ribosomal protein L29
MKRTELRQLRELSDEQLDAKLAELSEEGFRLRFRSATESTASPIRFRTIRRDVARINTILGERRRSANASQAGQAKG